MAFLWNFVKKYRLELAILVLLALVYFLFRLYQIMSLPIFTDEAIYIRWSQIARFDPSWRFISLTDGKQPLFIWLDTILIRFIHDPLLSARLISVFAGFATMTGLFFLGRELFKNRWIGILSAFLYLIFPFALVHDRMALYESLVGTSTIWSLYLEVLLIRRLRLDLALILGMVLGGGVLTKTSGFFSIYLMPFLFIIFDWKNKKRWERFLKFAGIALISIALAYGYYSILRLSPFFHIINEKNSIFVHSVSEWLTHPVRDLQSNLNGLIDWFITYFTGFFILFAIGAFFIKKEYLREKLLLFVWFLFPFAALALFGKILYPRFIFFMTLSLLPLVAFSIYSLLNTVKNKYIAISLVLLILILPLKADFFILSDFSKAPIPKSDKEQYIDGWPAGGGVKEAVNFFKEKASNEKIFIATEGTFGLMPYSLEIYLYQNPNVTIFGFWPVEQPPNQMIEASKKIPTYAVFYQPCPSCTFNGNAPPSWPLSLVARFKKGAGDNYLSIYKVSP